MTAPNPPPRGSAEPRVSDERDVEIMTQETHPGAPGLGWKLSAESEAALAEIDRSTGMPGIVTWAEKQIADLRAKLEAAEAETSRMLHRHIEFDGIRGEQLDQMFLRAKKAEARADAAEAALREMTEQRDGAWKAGALAMRNAAALELSGLAPFASRNDERQAQRFMREAGVAAIRALAPPAETARLADPSPNAGGGGAE